ncbi:MAG: adenylate kinase [Candidatus Marinimicrobia bacterium]|nr:adenylate kinase [Candidatus Neomarinimicrobiota bacterium]|tara:strand:+ start:117 stop:776 length:660 start_codon:yes stop_codon:yes gene_type:complete
MRLILLGPPGIGKGTQAKLLCKRHSLIHLSTGDMLRSAIEEKNELGRTAESYINIGKLVPDDLVLNMVEEKLDTLNNNRGFIFDGFPRTVPQATGFKELVNEMRLNLDKVLAINGDNSTLLKRLSSRRTCIKCERITNLLFSPPKVSGKCDKCSGDLFQRDDDKEDVIIKRLEIYKMQTEPLLDYYYHESLLLKISGLGSIDSVTKRIENELYDLIKEK